MRSFAVTAIPNWFCFIMLALSGASGLIGHYLCAELVERNIPFKVLGRQAKDFSAVQMKDFQFWDLSSPINESLSKFFDGVDVFIHLAALMPSSTNQLLDYYHCNGGCKVFV